MAGVGEEGRADDVMREDHRERTQAATVPTCASFPSGLSGLRRRFLASSFVLLKEKKKLTSILIYRFILLVQKL